MKIAYLDCASGISGDMTLGALVDAGVPLEKMQQGIDSLGLPSCRLNLSEVHRKGFRAAKVDVLHEPEHAHRHLHHITEMIERSHLSTAEQELAVKIFTCLGEAEAKVHGTTIRKVHFHEVGAVDSIADIVGAAIGWTHLGIEHFVCSPVPTGTGSIVIAHGRTSVPAPATAELLNGIPIAASNVEAELTTPTGAAIVKTLCQEFGPVPAMTIEGIGYGAGSKDFDTHGNILRILVGTCDGATATEATPNQIVVLETNLDDVSAEVIGHCTERLLKQGALDVFTTSIAMKKNRPATMLTTLCTAAMQSDLESIIFEETGTLGIRHTTADRSVLPRTVAEVETEWGPVSGKVATFPSGEHRFTPEFESCRKIATAKDVAVTRVLEAARLGFKT